MHFFAASSAAGGGAEGLPRVAAAAGSGDAGLAGGDCPNRKHHASARGCPRPRPPRAASAVVFYLFYFIWEYCSPHLRAITGEELSNKT